MKIRYTKKEIEKTIKTFRDWQMISPNFAERDNNLILPNYSKIITDQFSKGYCYHFAAILQKILDGGEIIFIYPFAHVVLKYEGKYYDIYGERTLDEMIDNWLSHIDGIEEEYDYAKEFLSEHLKLFKEKEIPSTILEPFLHIRKINDGTGENYEERSLEDFYWFLGMMYGDRIEVKGDDINEEIDNCILSSDDLMIEVYNLFEITWKHRYYGKYIAQNSVIRKMIEKVVYKEMEDNEDETDK